MERRKRSLVERARAAFRVKQHPGSSEEYGLKVYLPLPEDHTARHLVGTLTCERGEWTFCYDSGYAEDATAPAISAFPDKGKIYRSRDLWPFFYVRLPPLEREDIKEIVQREGLKEKDKLRLLGFLSRRAITSPFEFELV